MKIVRMPVLKGQDFQQKQSLDSYKSTGSDIIGMTLVPEMSACKGSANVLCINFYGHRL